MSAVDLSMYLPAHQIPSERVVLDALAKVDEYCPIAWNQIQAAKALESKGLLVSRVEQFQGQNFSAFRAAPGVHL